ncbi:DgyrCDS8389 [Dimorphilus gyrociliatus]|uniref:L-dopachrome isomerase n=1 Tax=Dimorphilus gyrociliatus TaxID=2664684 RepID=A0A7I8VZ48_9ANNE|nr:DgyrCDS8389 [Dimorphilus gyrociliatus]
MPLCEINTNVKNVPDDFLQNCSKVIAETLGKPITYVCVEVNTGKQMTFGATNEPCAIVKVASAGKISLEENKQHARNITQFITNSLGIADDRFYVLFEDLKRENVAFKNRILAE